MSTPKQKIIAALAEGVHQTQDLRERAGLSSQSCQRLLARLVDEGAIVRVRYGHYALPDGPRPVTGEQLAEEYAAGASLRDLAQRHDLSLTWVHELVVRGGATIRWAWPSGEDHCRWAGLRPEYAADLYADGQSVRQIAQLSGVDEELVRVRLRDAGISLAQVQREGIEEQLARTRHALRAGARRIPDLAAELGWPRHRVRDRLQRLMDRGEVLRVERGLYGLRRTQW